MDQKHLGIIIMVVGVIVGGLFFVLKMNEDAYIAAYIDDHGSCYLADGTCLHDERKMAPFIVGWSFSIAMLIFGAYIGFVDKTQKTLAQHQVQVSSALENAARIDKEKDEFRAFLSGFEEVEQKILKAIKEQPGIQQSTLRFKADVSKAKLSLILKNLERKDIIRRNEHGKTKQVYLVK